MDPVQVRELGLVDLGVLCLLRVGGVRGEGRRWGTGVNLAGAVEQRLE